MKETDCRKCCVCAFKDALCKEDFCEKYYREGSEEDFEKLLPHWIPCSERLPEANGRYLVTRGLKACGALWNRTYIINYSDLMGLKKEKIWWSGNVGKSDFERYDDVIAWTPLPEPYKERREG